MLLLIYTIMRKTMSKKKQNILIVDDEQGIRLSLQGILEDEGYQVTLAENGTQAIEILSQETFNALILDIWLSNSPNQQKTFHDDGILLLQQIKKNPLNQELPIIMISGHGTIETAVTALKYGAYDFIEKPLALDAVINTIKRALEVGSLKSENKALKSALANQKASYSLVGDSPAMLAFKSTLSAVAPTSVSVLITGENGTGKELAASSIHQSSQRADKAFIAVNCAAIPEELIESELFGHEKGSFTGAESRIGKFELADKGTLFLDEIGDMSLKTQAKILRILQEQSFERVGGNKTIQVDVRIIAATNKDLVLAMEEGSFRSDLYYRLCGFPLHLPPLRERASDIPLLIEALSQTMQNEDGLTPPLFTQEAMQRLMQSSWKGNVRELKHFLGQVAILYPKTLVEPSMLAPLLLNTSFQANNELSEAQESDEISKTFNHLLNLDFKSARNEFEAWYLEQKLKDADNNISKLSEQIGLERSYLHKKLKSLLDK